MSIKQLFKDFLYSRPLRNIILFESLPDYSDNTFAVYQEMKRRKLDEKYKLVWRTHDFRGWHKYGKNDYSIHPDGHKLKYLLLRSTARCVVSCNISMGSTRPDQFSIYLAHGSPFKKVAHYYHIPETVTCMLSQAECFRSRAATELNYPPDKCYPLGFARNDVLTHPTADLKKVFGDYRKYIIWYPTVRQFKHGRSVGLSESLPVIHDEAKAVQLNETVKRLHMLIILKPHFAQNTDLIKKLDLSNIRIINDDFLKENHLPSYEMLASSDALLTDYSSVFYDYMLVDKPIGMIWEDIEEFRKNNGFVEEAEEYMGATEKLYTIEDLCAFVERVSAGTDVCHDERNRICDIVNAQRDGRIAERITDFIIERAHL